MAAIESGHFQVVQYLVTQGADADAKFEVCGCIQKSCYFFRTIMKSFAWSVL